ncbi:MAG: damage-inducible protein DinB [Rhodospirillaceae bacterium]|nr:damage-inducible protein DinB [Rhodospirillaceae bacterium]
MSGSWSSYFGRLAAYNTWANLRLYAACDELSESAYLQSRAAFFGGIHGTLNHILVGDRIWFARFEGRQPAVTALDQQLYGDLAGLRVARVAEDARIEAFVRHLGEDDFDQQVAYQNLAGESYEQPLGALLGHVFNHQTHHRGQVHAMMTAAGQTLPDTDLPFMPGAEE